MSNIAKVALGDICEVNIGRTPARENREYWGVGFPWLSIADMHQGRVLSKTKEQITQRAVVETRMQPAPTGTVLLSFKLSIGKVGIAATPLFTNEAIAALPIKDPTKLIPEFLFWALQSIDLTAGQDRAAMGLTLNKAKLLTLQIPLPPLNEQRRIAAILDQAETLRTQRRTALALLDSLTQSLFLDMFGDPVANPKGWPLEALKVLGKVSTGSTPPGGQDGMFGGSIPFLTPGDLESDLPAKRTVTESGAEHAVTVRAGAALVCCIGATIGKSDIAIQRSAFNQQLNAVDWGSSIDDIYGLIALRALKPIIISRGASTTMPILKKSSFEQLQIYVPPLPLQQTFATRIAAIEALKATHRRALAALDALFASLQQRAFAGQL